MDSLTYLFALERFGIKFGLDNIRALARALGDPQDSFRSILIAGTNGKGSVTAMVETALRAAGHRTARYTSPHLVDLRERFVIAGSPVSNDALAASADRVRAVIEGIVSAGELATHPTFFEATTAMAFDLFREAGVEVAVLEVGLGGRFDSTNIVTPLVGAITSIDLDHERYLGNTIPEIAFEKAGIIKPGMVLVCGETKPDAVAVITGICRDRGAECIASAAIAVEEHFRRGRVAMSAWTGRGPYGEMLLSLRGRHQGRNARVALTVLEQIDLRGLSVPMDAVRIGLTEARWRGRLEMVDAGRDRWILLDAAHNPAGMCELARYLGDLHGGGLPMVFGAMQDKSYREMLRTILPRASSLVIAQPKHSRAILASDLAAEAAELAPGLPIEVEPDSVAAAERAWHKARTICATGSIFLIGELLAALDARMQHEVR